MYIKKCDICGKEISCPEHLSVAGFLECNEGDTEDTSLCSTIPMDRIDICKDCKYKLLKGDYLDRDIKKAIINGLKLDAGFLVE